MPAFPIFGRSVTWCTQVGRLSVEGLEPQVGIDAPHVFSQTIEDWYDLIWVPVKMVENHDMY